MIKKHSGGGCETHSPGKARPSVCTYWKMTAEQYPREVPGQGDSRSMHLKRSLPFLAQGIVTHPSSR